MRGFQALALIALLGMGLEAPLAWAKSPKADPSADRNPDWLKKPTTEDLLGVWPKDAMERGLDGKATIKCIVTIQGRLRNCVTLSEKPAGVGFGAAALMLAPQLLMRPGLKAGEPVESEVNIPVSFDMPDRGRGQSPDFPATKVIANMVWKQAPTVADVAAAYPAKARLKQVDGAITMDCEINKAGALKGCVTIREEPAGVGFAAAAHQLAKIFVAPTADGAGASLVGAHTQVPFTFDKTALSAQTPVVGKPRWVALPGADDLLAVVPDTAWKAGLKQVRVILSCMIMADGRLSDCQVASEEPTGAGVGEGALRLAHSFQVSVWTVEGLPTVGAVVRVPIRFDLTTLGPPPAK